MATYKTVTVDASGADYTSVIDAIDGEFATQPDLTATSGDLIIQVQDGYADTTDLFNAAGKFTTDATHRVIIEGASNLSGPKWDTAKARIDANTGMANALIYNDFCDDLVLRDIQIRRADNPGFSNRHVIHDLASGGTFLMERCLVVADGDPTVSVVAVHLDNSMSSKVIRDSVIYTDGAWANAIRNGDSNLVLENVAIDGFSGSPTTNTLNGSVEGTNVRVTNCGAIDGADWDTGSNYNLTDEAGAPNAFLGTNGIDSATLSYADAGNATLIDRDFSIDTSDDGYEAGNVIAGHPGTDIAGTDRTDPWDIGPHEASTAAAGPLSPPSSVTVSGGTDTTLDVSWTDNTDGAAQHRVYYRLSPSNDPWQLAATLPEGTTSDTVTGLVPGATYDIGVAAYDPDTDTESAIVFDTGTTSGGVTKPTNLQVTGVTATTVSLSWTPTSDLTHRVYYRTPVGSGAWTLFDTINVGTSVATVTGLSTGVQYQFGVASWDGATESSKTTTTATTVDARWVQGVHFLGTEGKNVVEAEGGVMVPGTGADDGAGTKTLPKGVRSGTVAHLGSIVYAEPYQNTPLVVPVGGGLSVQGASEWGTKAAVDADTASSAPPTSYGPQPVFEGDATGFTAYLYLRSSVALADEAESLAAPFTLSALGVTGSATPAAADLPAVDDTYSVDFSGTMTSGLNGAADITVALEARLNGGAWGQIGSASKTFSFKGTNDTWNFSGTISGTIANMDGSGTDQFRCRLVSMSSPLGDGDNSEVSVTFGPSIEWQSGNPSFASMTPSAGHEVGFVVIGNTGGA